MAGCLLVGAHYVEVFVCDLILTKNAENIADELGKVTVEPPIQKMSPLMSQKKSCENMYFLGIGMKRSWFTFV